MDDKRPWERSAVSRWSRLDLTFLHCALKQFAASPYFTVSQSGWLASSAGSARHDQHDGWSEIAVLFSGFLCRQNSPPPPFCVAALKSDSWWKPAWIPVKVRFPFSSVRFSFTWRLQTEPRGRDGGRGGARSAGVSATSRTPRTHHLLEERRRQPGWQRRTNYSKRWLRRFICASGMTSSSGEFREIIFFFFSPISVHTTALRWSGQHEGLSVL